ncbi:hypothetical protein [Herbaspirillum sp. ST 5-3]|uniref:hypothetical protein n=1 Tax=Oxalobacteraceae TaxID=75682 RepID=UPI0010A380E4|nr:hypothetical protein [Herbaspirillum sp. ST 5-3]
MSGDASWLIEAIEQRKLVQRMQRSQVTLFEPQAYVRVAGGRDALIAYQVEGETRHHAAPHQWFVLILDAEALVPDPKRRFSAAREIPPNYQAQIQKLYLRAKSK